MHTSRVLYIDDDPDALELYQDILGDDFELETCGQPKAGLKLIEEHQYDAILLDIYMPDLNGFELFEKIKKMETNNTTPIFFISSENTVENRLKAFGLGSEDFINREMDPDEVIARIKNRLVTHKNKAQGHSNEENILQFGDIEIDKNKLIARCNGEIKELTQTEFRLAMLLVTEALENPGSVLDRETIIKFVWPLDHETVWPRTLSTHLTNLRKKLDSKRVKIASKRQTGFHLILT